MTSKKTIFYSDVPCFVPFLDTNTLINFRYDKGYVKKMEVGRDHFSSKKFLFYQKSYFNIVYFICLVTTNKFLQINQRV